MNPYTEEFEALQETDYLMKSPANAFRLDEAINEIEEAIFKEDTQ